MWQLRAGGLGKGLLLYGKQGKYILVWKYSEKTACIPKSLEKSGWVLDQLLNKLSVCVCE